MKTNFMVITEFKIAAYFLVNYKQVSKCPTPIVFIVRPAELICFSDTINSVTFKNDVRNLFYI